MNRELTTLPNNLVTKNITGITKDHGVSECRRRFSSHYNGKPIYNCNHKHHGKVENCMAQIKRATYYQTRNSVYVEINNEPLVSYEYFHNSVKDDLIVKEFKLYYGNEVLNHLIDIDVVDCNEKLSWSLATEYAEEQLVAGMMMTAPNLWGAEYTYLVAKYRNAFTQDQMIEFLIKCQEAQQINIMRHESALRQIADKMNQAGNCLSF